MTSPYRACLAELLFRWLKSSLSLGHPRYQAPVVRYLLKDRSSAVVDIVECVGWELVAVGAVDAAGTAAAAEAGAGVAVGAGAGGAGGAGVVVAAGENDVVEKSFGLGQFLV